MLILGLVKHW